MLGGELWLPFAKKKLIALVKRLRGKGWGKHVYQMPDSTLVTVELTGAEPSITILGKLDYEFFTSEPVHQVIYSTRRSFTGDAFVGGSAVRASSFLLKPKPLFSTQLAPDVDNPKWAARAQDYKHAPNQYPDSEQFRSWAAWQNQKFFEYITWPKNGSDSMVSSTQAQAPGMNNQCNWTANFADSYLDTGLFVQDTQIDVQSTYYDKQGSKTGRPVFENERIWQRHAAVQIVGGRKFFISSDNYGRFQIYPVKAYPHSEAFINDFPVSTYYTLTPPYPGWVTLPSVGSGNVCSNQWLWAFNKDATKAVSCPFHSVSSGGWIHQKPDTFCQKDFAKDFDENEVFGTFPGYNVISGRHDTPGLVEFSIVITVTGEGDFDFTVECLLLRNSYAPTNGRYFFDAAYSLPDKEKNGLMPWPEDTLVTSEIEAWVKPGDYTAVAPEGLHYTKTPCCYITIAGNNADMTGSTVALRLPVNIGSRLFDGSLYPMTAPNISNTYKYEFVNIMSLELRTMSIHYVHNSTKTGLVTTVLMAYNRTIENYSSTAYSIAAGAELSELCTEQVPIAAVPIYQLAVFFGMRTSWGRGFSAHPAGHWSHYYRPTGETLDIVQPRRGKRTSHKALYNRAFGQTRDYSYYATPAYPPAPHSDADLVERFDATYGYLGGFRTNGVWMTF